MTKASTSTHTKVTGPTPDGSGCARVADACQVQEALEAVRGGWWGLPGPQVRVAGQAGNLLSGHHQGNQGPVGRLTGKENMEREKGAAHPPCLHSTPALVTPKMARLGNTTCTRARGHGSPRILLFCRAWCCQEASGQAPADQVDRRARRWLTGQVHLLAAGELACSTLSTLGNPGCCPEPHFS